MNKKQKNESGMSALAETSPKNKIVTVVLGCVVLASVGSLYFFTGENTSLAKAPEDTYQLDEAITSMPATPVASIPMVAPASNTEQASTVSPLSKEEIASLIEKQKELQLRLAAPLMAVSSASNQAQETSAEKSSQETNPNLRFMEQVASQDVQKATATVMSSPSTTVAQGYFIHAILESATNSDLPGFLRAVVSEPVYSEDGKNILIPRGSWLVGEYKSGMLQGQSRIFFVWSRVITPAYSIQLGSSGTDSLGVSGMGADVIDRHFWQRFGMASLLSMISTGAANIGVNSADQNNSASAYRSAVASSFSQSASESLQQDGLVAPTLKTYQGKPIMIFVAKDLDFANAMKTVNSSFNVF